MAVPFDCLGFATEAAICLAGLGSAFSWSGRVGSGLGFLLAAVLALAASCWRDAISRGDGLTKACSTWVAKDTIAPGVVSMVGLCSLL